jgi:hypothetical protein
MGIRIVVVVTLACVLVGVLCLPLLLQKVPPNLLYGFRTARTLSNPDIWYPANAFSAKAMLLAMVLVVAGVWALPASAPEWTPLALLLAGIGAVLAASFLHLRRYGRSTGHVIHLHRRSGHEAE